MRFDWDSYHANATLVSVNWKDIISASDYHLGFLQIENQLNEIMDGLYQFEKWASSWHQIQLGKLQHEIATLQSLMDSVKIKAEFADQNVISFDFLESNHQFSSDSFSLTANHERLSLPKKEKRKSIASHLRMEFNSGHQKPIMVYPLSHLIDESELTYFEMQVIHFHQNNLKKVVRPDWFTADYSAEDAHVVLRWHFDVLHDPAMLSMKTIEGLKMEIVRVDCIAPKNEIHAATQMSATTFDCKVPFQSLRIYLRQRFSKKEKNVQLFRFGLKQLQLQENEMENSGVYISKIVDVTEPDMGLSVELITQEREDELPNALIQVSIGAIENNQLQSWIPIQPKNKRFAHDVLRDVLIDSKHLRYVWFLLRMKAKPESIRLYRGKDEIEPSFFTYEDGKIGYEKTMYQSQIELICQYEPIAEEQTWIPSQEAAWFVQPTGERGELFHQLSNQYSITLQEEPWIDLKRYGQYNERFDRYLSEEPEELVVIVNGEKYKNQTDYTAEKQLKEMVVKEPNSFLHVGKQLFFPVVLFEENVSIEVHYQVMKLPVVCQVNIQRFAHVSAHQDVTVEALRLVKLEGDF